EFLEANAAFERHTGLRDVVGRCMRTLAPTHEKYWFEIYGRVARTGESVRFENHAAALEERWFDVFAFRVDAPEANRVAILFTDITARKRAALELERVLQAEREANALLDALGSCAPVGLAFLDRELRFQRVNPVLAEMNGLSVEAHLGKRPS